MIERDTIPRRFLPRRGKKRIVGVGRYCAGDLLFIGGAALSSFDDLLRTVEIAATDEHIPGPMKILIDARGTRLEPSYEEISALARFVGTKMSRFGPRAAIVVSDDFHYGLARIGTAYASASGIETEVFFSIREALRWLRTGRELRQSTGKEEENGLDN